MKFKPGFADGYDYDDDVNLANYEQLQSTVWPPVILQKHNCGRAEPETDGQEGLKSWNFDGSLSCCA